MIEDGQPRLDFASSDAVAGFRLHRLEVYNWGTFHGCVWSFEPGGENALLTGDIGSGKSTLVDALTTLLVAPQKLAYNRAAGAEARERTLRSYVLGYYKSERGEPGLSARPVALRDHNTYSVVLARFVNVGYAQHVTLAQVFWVKDADGQPARCYVIADRPLAIATDFAGFGTDVGELRKRLRHAPGVEVHESFPGYGAAFRRRFGIENEQALDLFHQTVSMKSVGNLTEFVRQHMLEAFAVEPRIDALVRHFDDLNRAHEAVLRAREQIEALTPIVEDCRRHAGTAAAMDGFRACRDALRAWYAAQKATLLEKRLDILAGEARRTAARIEALTLKRSQEGRDRDQLKHDIAVNGGDRIEQLRAELATRREEREQRRRRVERYDELARACGLPPAIDADAFLSTRAALDERTRELDERLADRQNEVTEASVGLGELRRQHEPLRAEIDSLRRRRSNIPDVLVRLRERLCAGIGLAEDDLPFAGELIEVRGDEQDWEGAIERLLHGFGLAILVPEAAYGDVARWVERTHLATRLVYFRTRPARGGDRRELGPRSLVHKLTVKPDSAFYDWLMVELARRFDYACCDTLDDFRREPQAVTRAGQAKGRDDRHEKDDRHRIDDRSRYVLGWSNEAKVAALEKEALDLEARMQAFAGRIARAQEDQKRLQLYFGQLRQLATFESWRELDCKSLTTEIERLEAERRALEAASDVLRELEARLTRLEEVIAGTEVELVEQRGVEKTLQLKGDQATELLAQCRAAALTASEAVRSHVFPRVEALRTELLGEHALTVESCDGRERDLREAVQARIDAESKTLDRLTTRIVAAMESYRIAYPLETQEVDASVAASADYAQMLDSLRADDIPRFEARFKELLNENTIREVAAFQSQLRRERQTILERISRINESLHAIDYNPGRFIVLEAVPATDPEIRDLQQDLRACTEGTLTGSEDAAYSEAKFLEVKRIIERFRGREGSSELDKRWTRKVTDVRNWFSFSASERWREDGREHEHYADSGGKSGGQKEKLAYTVLAASLAYQFGLEWGATRSRSFRFVVIDEAFGRGSDESARFGLELFDRLGLQLLIVTPMQKIHVIEPHVRSVGFVHNEEGQRSKLRNLTIEEYRAERARRIA